MVVTSWIVAFVLSLILQDKMLDFFLPNTCFTSRNEQKTPFIRMALQYTFHLQHNHTTCVPFLLIQQDLHNDHHFTSVFTDHDVRF